MRFSRQADIHAYIERVVDEHGLPAPALRSGPSPAAYDEARALGVTTGAGERCARTSWSRRRPALPARRCRTSRACDALRGPAFHSARWDHDVPLHGKRVAVVGTGASAIQFVPQVAQRGEPADGVPAVGAVGAAQARRPLPGSAQAVVPPAPGDREAWAERSICCCARSSHWAWSTCRCCARACAWLAGWHLRHQVADAGLRAKLTPDYAPGASGCCSPTTCTRP